MYILNLFSTNFYKYQNIAFIKPVNYSNSITFYIQISHFNIYMHFQTIIFIKFRPGLSFLQINFKDKAMKIELPLETWTELFGFVPRSQLKQLVPHIGETRTRKRDHQGRKCHQIIGYRQFVSFIQFYLHKCGEVTLGWLHIKSSINKPIVIVDYNEADQMPLADVPIPENVKDFQSIRISNFNESVAAFLQQFQRNSLLTNVNLCFYDCLGFLPQIMTNFVPLFTNINSIQIHSGNLAVLDQLQSAELAIPMFTSTRVLIANYFGYNPWYSDWLHNPREDRKPRVLSLRDYNANDGSFSHFIEQIKKDFLDANQAVSFFVKLQILRDARVQSQTMENTQTREKLVIKGATGCYNFRAKFQQLEKAMTSMNTNMDGHLDEKQPPAKKSRNEKTDEQGEIAKSNEAGFPKSAEMTELKESETSTTTKTMVDLPRPRHRKLSAELDREIYLCFNPTTQRKFIYGLGWDFYAMFRYRLLTKTKRLRNPHGNLWNRANTRATVAADGLNVSNTNGFPNVFAEQPFPTSGPQCRVDEFPGTILYYYEVKGDPCLVGLSCAIIDNSWIGQNSNSYAIFIVGCDRCRLAGEYHRFELPEGAIQPTRNIGIGNVNVYGCGLVLDPDNKLTIFFTLNGQLLGRKIPISPTVDRLFPAVKIWDESSFVTNFGDDPAKPFEYDIQKCPGLELACI